MTWTSLDAKRLMQQSGAQHPIEALKKTIAALLADAMQAAPPVDLRLLASIQRVKRIEEIRMGHAGRIRYDRLSHSWIIEINADHTAGKKRFSTAHEIMHTLRPSWRAGDETYDGTTGAHLHLDWTQLKEREERELLCDVGAAEILYPRKWLVGNIPADRLAISSIQELASICCSSLDSAAFQLSKHCSLPSAIVMWEPGLRKSDQPKSLTQSLPGFHAAPEFKYRVVRVYPTTSFRSRNVFIPLRKSVPSDSIIAQCEQAGITSGRILIPIGRGEMEFHSENLYAPYGNTQRIISILRPA